MPKFFIDKNQISEDSVIITGENARHISRSLRMTTGDKIVISDMNGYDYDCVLTSFTDATVTAKITKVYSSNSESSVRIHLYQALPKGDKLDFIIQKSVECGVYDITPFESANCIVKIKNDAETKKCERRNKISLEAAKQCGRGIVPKVNPTCTFDSMLNFAMKSDLILFCYEGINTVPIAQVLKNARLQNNIKDISVIIGSEGGFSTSEAERAERCDFVKVGLGKRILRTETAAIFALSCIIYEFDLD